MSFIHYDGKLKKFDVKSELIAYTRATKIYYIYKKEQTIEMKDNTILVSVEVEKTIMDI